MSSSSGAASPAAPSVVVRRATVEDAAAIAAVLIDNWRLTYRDQLSTEFLASLDLEEQTKRWRERISRPGVHVLVAEQGEFLGFVACGPPFDTDLDPARCHQIYNVHVTEDGRGRGTGKRLLKEAAALGAARGATELCLWVVPENRRAREVYERAGLVADGTSQREALSLGATLEEIRYRGPIASVTSWD